MAQCSRQLVKHMYFYYYIIQTNYRRTPIVFLNYTVYLTCKKKRVCQGCSYKGFFTN